MRRLATGVLGTLLLGTLLIGCQAVTEMKLPDGVEGPATYNNREGAIRLTQGARSELATAIRDYIISSGLLTDELTSMQTSTVSRDQRSGHWIGNPPHTVRSLARLARGVVGKYVAGNTAAWQARLFVYEAYAELLTADGWCSGVPLSTLDFEGDWTYRAGSTTEEIYAHAILLLDSAAVRAVDSVPLQSTIRVLKARALVALGRYAEARQVVQGIDGAFRDTLRIAFDEGQRGAAWFTPYEMFLRDASIADQEGRNGLPYLSSHDPRTQAVQQTFAGRQSYFPVKYLTTDSSTFVLASGVEAQLIRAEAAWHAEDPSQMLALLNALRTDGTYTIDTTALPGGGERIDTLWHAGIGGVAGLRPLQGTATPATQRHLLFTERAAWLFVTGARQGDLRRLVRTYGVDREQVYPTGSYAAPGYTGVYGSDISFGLSAREFRNPLFTGCHDDE